MYRILEYTDILSMGRLQYEHQRVWEPLFSTGYITSC